MPHRGSRTQIILTAVICLAIIPAVRIGLADDSPLLRGSRSALTESHNETAIAGDHRFAAFFMRADSPTNSQSSVQQAQLRVPDGGPSDSDGSDPQRDETPFFLKLDTPAKPIPAPPASDVPEASSLLQSHPASAPHGTPGARAVRRSGSGGVGSHPLRGALRSVVCDCQSRWVNWRCSSDYLEGCIPDGYTALSLINSTPPAALDSTPRHFRGPVEPGGNESDSRLISGPDSVPINRLTFDVAPPPGDFPDNQAELKFKLLASRTHLPGTRRIWAGTTCYWDASHLIHQPLYFEDVNLERHGYSWGIAQPVVSAARFYATFPILPYLVVAEPHSSAEYTLGERRPGSPAPYVCDFPPSSPRAGVFEAAVITGLFFVIP